MVGAAAALPAAATIISAAQRAANPRAHDATLLSLQLRCMNTPTSIPGPIDYWARVAPYFNPLLSPHPPFRGCGLLHGFNRQLDVFPRILAGNGRS
jgi:hypothetical protein